MKWFTREHVLRISGVLLILTGSGFSLSWYLWLLPQGNRYDLRDRFTTKQYWIAAQNDIHRYGWYHDNFLIVGEYGDEHWAKWIMDRAAAGATLYGCGNDGHKEEALKYITNQDPSGGNDANGQKQWLQWWAENRGKSQLEWIQAGFLRYKVTASIPPSVAEQESLLGLMGNDSTNEAAAIPRFVKYNAFRWLRDSGFSPVGFALSNRMEAIPAVVQQGLLEYEKRYEWLPRRDEVGILPLCKTPEKKFVYPEPLFRTMRFQVILHGIMIVPVVAGVCLLLLARRSRRNASLHSGDTAH